MKDYSWVTNEMFDAALICILKRMKIEEILHVDGVYCVLKEYLNNEVLNELCEEKYGRYSKMVKTKDEVKKEISDRVEDKQEVIERKNERIARLKELLEENREMVAYKDKKYEQCRLKLRALKFSLVHLLMSDDLSQEAKERLIEDIDYEFDWRDIKDEGLENPTGEWNEPRSLR